MHVNFEGTQLSCVNVWFGSELENYDLLIDTAMTPPTSNQSGNK